MTSLLRKLFGSSAAPSIPALPQRDPVRCAELKKRGNDLLAKGMLEEAGRAYRAASFADQEDVAALVNLGYVLCEQKDQLAARQVLQQVLVMDPVQGDAHFMLGILQQELGDLAAATFHLGEVLRLRPDFNITQYFSTADMHKGAVERCAIILSIEPENAVAHMSLGMTSLLLGDYETGWREYQWRFRVNEKGQTHKSYSRPLWLGESPIHGKTILLHWEQGYGDTLHFCRYARDVALLGARVLLQVQKGLGSLLSGLDGVLVLIEDGEPLPEFDVYCPLMSLPLALGHCGPDLVSGRQPYLRAESARIEYWCQRLDIAGMSDAPRTGIVWSGSPAHRADLQRSIPLDTFVKVLGDHARVVSLQPVVRQTDTAAMQADGRIVFLGEELSDFAETAALISALDLVITVDTSVAHLAGALGKTVWVLLPHSPDWRWQLDGSDTHWYRDMRLFRQQTADDWTHPLAEIRAALAERAQACN